MKKKGAYFVTEDDATKPKKARYKTVRLANGGTKVIYTGSGRTYEEVSHAVAEMIRDGMKSVRRDG